MGAHARAILPHLLGVTDTSGLQRGDVNGRDVHVVFLAHPAGGERPKTFTSALEPEALAELRAVFVE